MFRRRRQLTLESPAISISHSVRLLKDGNELQAAVERARDFERRGVDAGQRRVGSYERFLVAPAENLAPVVPIMAQMESGVYPVA